MSQFPHDRDQVQVAYVVSRAMRGVNASWPWFHLTVHRQNAPASLLSGTGRRPWAVRATKCVKITDVIAAALIHAGTSPDILARARAVPPRFTIM